MFADRIRSYLRRRKTKTFLMRELPQALFGHIDEVSDEDMDWIRSKFRKLEELVPDVCRTLGLPTKGFHYSIDGATHRNPEYQKRMDRVDRIAAETSRLHKKLGAEKFNKVSQELSKMDVDRLREELGPEKFEKFVLDLAEKIDA